jgi:hypothetical protein
MKINVLTLRQDELKSLVRLVSKRDGTISFHNFSDHVFHSIAARRDSARNKLFACSRFTRDEDRRTTRRDFGDAREYSFQSWRGSNNLSKHRGLIDFFA